MLDTFDDDDIKNLYDYVDFLIWRSRDKKKESSG